MKLSIEQLRRRVKVWQKRLRLQDWNIAITFAQSSVMGPGKRLAQVTTASDKKYALITILTPEEFPPECLVEQDHEIDLVHELLEIHFDVITNDLHPLEELAKEQAIEATSRALVEAYRQGGENSKPKV